ncbi:WD domain, G-beta repeat [Symmachiella dynata]|uniref:WD40 repeat domain-containing protein n=1 Tax=Symmachiella dynata TaxID=2527995 RepID=UPI00118D3642|nr:WD40 repeat domain-containing protein [Symmachiella dynata]QDT50540.1 WD domain, G-beta repeat [Symmachiella dynata]
MTTFSDVAQKVNPYVGSRPFVEKDADYFFGRDREVSELTSLLLSERIVLLNAASGAGKSSLIHAGLLPKLRNRFHIRPTIRITHQVRDGEPLYNKNPYIDSAIHSFLSVDEDSFGLKSRFAGEGLGLSLTDALAGGDNRDRRRELLIFDQFEDVLRLDPTDLEDKIEFFNQVGDLLNQTLDHDDCMRWALFSIREEFVAALEPYAHLIPGRFNTVFRITPLDRSQALHAIQEPALRAGVEIEDDVARELVEQLAKVRVMRSGNCEAETVSGVYVEPLHLQIVCRRIWSNFLASKELEPEKDHITIDEVNATNYTAGRYVDQCLVEHYDETIHSIANDPKIDVDERHLRIWIDHHLVTELGLRGQVPLGVEATHGLDNKAVDALSDAHLIRLEVQKGTRWAELTHDRILAPIAQSNKKWFETNLSPLQSAAHAWTIMGRPADFLFAGGVLADAQAWADQNSESLTASEMEFLDQSRSRSDALQQRAKTKRQYIFLGLVTTGLIVALMCLLLLKIRSIELEQEGQSQYSSSLALNALIEKEKHPLEALVLACYAGKLHAALRDTNAQQKNKDPKIAIVELLAHSGGRPLVEPNGRGIAHIVLKQDHVFTASKNGRVLLWTGNALKSEQPTPKVLFETRNSWPMQMAISKDEKWLAIAWTDGVTLCQLDPQRPDAPIASKTYDSDTSVTKIRFFHHPTTDSDVKPTWLCAGTAAGNVELWDISVGLPERQIKLKPHSGSISAIGFTEEHGGLLATGSDGGEVRLWNMKMLRESMKVPNQNQEIKLDYATVGHNDDLTDLEFNHRESSDVEAMSGNDRDSEQGFEWKNTKKGNWLVTASINGTVRLWYIPKVIFDNETKTLNASTAPLIENKSWSDPINNESHCLDHPRNDEESSPAKGIVDIAISSHDNLLVSGSNGGIVQLWSLHELMKLPFGQAPVAINGIKMTEREKLITDIAISTDEKWIATSSKDKSVTLWEALGTHFASNDNWRSQKLLLPNAVNAILFNREDVDQFVTLEEDGVARIWDLKDLDWLQHNLFIDRGSRQRRVELDKKSLNELVDLGVEFLQKTFGSDAFDATSQSVHERFGLRKYKISKMASEK